MVLKPGSLCQVLAGVYFGCCSDHTSSVFCCGSRLCSLYEGKNGQVLSNKLQCALWGKVIDICSPLSTGNEHDVKSEVLQNCQLEEAEWIISLFCCLLSKWIIVCTDNALAKTIHWRVSMQFPFHVKTNIASVASPFITRVVAGCAVTELSFLLCLWHGFGELHQTKFNCGRPRKTSIKGSC